MTSYYAETSLYNANTIQHAKKKNREHIQMLVQKLITLVMLFYLSGSHKKKKKDYRSLLHLHSQQWLST